MSKTALYVLFAGIATLVNLVGQEATTTLIEGQDELLFSMLIGTTSGLVTKYLLDKQFIFKHFPKTTSEDLFKFILYSCMGIITTFIFWVTEYTFDAWFETKLMRYVGAVIGLSVGYALKYYLDKNFVFKSVK